MVKALNILLVDDEAGVLSALKMLLSLIPATVTTSNSAKEALVLYKSNKYDLVISDLRMPEMDGKELFLELKKLNAGLKFILISGHADEEEITRLNTLGIKCFLPKPFSLEDMKSLVNRLQSL